MTYLEVIFFVVDFKCTYWLIPLHSSVRGSCRIILQQGCFVQTLGLERFMNAGASTSQRGTNLWQNILKGSLDDFDIQPRDDYELLKNANKLFFGRTEFGKVFLAKIWTFYLSHVKWFWRTIYEEGYKLDSPNLQIHAMNEIPRTAIELS